MTSEDALKLRRCCQSIISAPRSMEAQWYQFKQGFIWCEDWEMIEILKYLFLGKDLYYGDPPPRRLKNNPLWSREGIEQKAEELVRKLGTVDMIIEEIRNRRGMNARGA